MFEQLTRIETLKRAWERVKANRGGPGIDGQTIEDYETALDENLIELCGTLSTGLYDPKPVKTVTISEGQKQRIIGIPAVQDRIVQQALTETLTPILEPIFSDNSFAYRPGRSAKMAVDKVQRCLRQGFVWVAETDIANFFGTIKHDILLDKLAEYVNDRDLIRLVGQLLTGDIMGPNGYFLPEQGTIQGSALSPLLANLYLHEVDAKMASTDFREIQYFRYSDDLLILARTREKAVFALKTVSNAMAILGLALKQEKTRICHSSDDFVFLGFCFNHGEVGVPEQAIESLSNQLNRLAKENMIPSSDLDAMEKAWVGWQGYYGSNTVIKPNSLPFC